LEFLWLHLLRLEGLQRFADVAFLKEFAGGCEHKLFLEVLLLLSWRPDLGFQENAQNL
jgi:hypothetical protein